MTAQVRVGIGYDIHRLVSDRPLVLAGVRVPHDRGLLGHSDGDAVLHALTDALLGATGLGDIGELFPDTDAAYQDADSAVLLGKVVDRVRAAGWRPTNVDVVIHAERPNLSSYKPAMADRIAGLLGISLQDVNVKAKTNEGVGPIGERIAIACTAVAVVVRA